MAMKTVEFEGFEIVYGTSARENDELSIKLAKPQDFWFHAAGYAGTHVIVRNPDGLADLPRDVEREAARIAVVNSKAKTARGKIDVHVTWAKEVSKRKGAPTGQVTLRSYRSVKVYAKS